jgi:hypothetical protein
MVSGDNVSNQFLEAMGCSNLPRLFLLSPGRLWLRIGLDAPDSQFDLSWACLDFQGC